MIPILGPTLVSEFVNEYCNAPDRFASLSEVDRLEVMFYCFYNGDIQIE